MHDDRVAERQMADSGAEGSNDTRELVAHDRLEDTGSSERGAAGRVLMKVGAADAAVANVEYYLALLRDGIRDLAEFHPPGRREGNRFQRDALSADSCEPRLVDVAHILRHHALGVEDAAVQH